MKHYIIYFEETFYTLSDDDTIIETLVFDEETKFFEEVALNFIVDARIVNVGFSHKTDIMRLPPKIM